jgi:hypothetical protein
MAFAARGGGALTPSPRLAVLVFDGCRGGGARVPPGST